jgi:hypothetical protein
VVTWPQQQPQPQQGLGDSTELVSRLRGASGFDALSQVLHGSAGGTALAELIGDRSGVPLAAVASALIRTAGLTHPREPWQVDKPASVSALARALVHHGAERLARLPAPVLEALNHPVVYRHSLNVYNEGVRRRQSGPLPAPVQPEPAADGLMEAVLVLERALALPNSGMPPLGPPREPGARLAARGTLATPGVGPRPDVSPLLKVQGARIPEQAFEPTTLDTGGRHLFVIPDVHGNQQLLRALLGTLGRLIVAQRLDPARVSLVQGGDLLNKGADPAGVVRLLRGVEEHAVQGQEGALRGLTGTSSRVLRSLEGLGELVQLRGNHEELAGYALHMDPKAPIADYAAKTAEMLGKGLPETIRSYLLRYPEAFAPEERRWLQQALARHPARDAQGAWTWRGDAGAAAPEEAQAHDFYREFQRIWPAALARTGDLETFLALRPASEFGNILITHGGPPASARGMSRLMAHLRRAQPLDDRTLHQILWRRAKGEADLLTRYAMAVQNISTPPTALVHGHTMGGALGRQAIGGVDYTSIFLDLGFGLNVLPMLYVKPAGLATLVVAQRNSKGIEVGASRPGDLLPRPGNKELPNRFSH